MATVKQARNLRDIARELNVSVSLVSKVLNRRLGTSGAREDTVNAILAKARELGYRRNNVAAALISGRQNALGVFIHSVGEDGSGISQALVEGIADEAACARLRLMLFYFGGPERFRELLAEAHHNAMDGLIIGGVMHRELVRDLKDLRGRGLPIVTVYDDAIDPDFPNVGMHQYRVGREATLHLVRQGCRRIAHVSNDPGRRQGYEAALRESGLSIDPELIYEAGDYKYRSGELAAAKWLDDGVEFDGVVGQSDPHALGVLHTLLRRGVKVPEQVRVIGVDDSPYCPLTYVPLSSVSQEHRVRGAAAVKAVLGRLAGETIESTWVEPRVCPRRSSLVPEGAGVAV
jgi:LacI family transcriptional regulator